MSIFNPGLVLYDYDQPKTTDQERADHKSRRRDPSRRLRALVEKLDEIVRRSRASL